jgi:hypothetical protein
MNIQARIGKARGNAASPNRAEALDWTRIADDLAAQGSAVMEKLLTPEECRAMAALYAKEEPFRSRIVMARHGFGRGEYKYFAYPLPPLIADLRAALYARLAPVANHWNGLMKIPTRYPEAHAELPRRLS